MTIAYAYFRFIIDREFHKATVYYFSDPSDVQLITEESASRDWVDMGNDKAQDNDPAKAEGAETTEPVTAAVSGRRRGNYLNKFKHRKCCSVFAQSMFVGLSLLAIVLSLAVIIVTVVTSIATKVFDTEQSNRLVGMVILAVTAAVAISMLIYSVVAVFKKQTKPIHAASIVLLILATIQAILAGVSVKVGVRDELNLGKSLAESFKLAREDNPRHVKLWAATQNDLTCCGVIGPDDYRGNNLPYYFPPNVPISCCPSFDPGRSELVQEREREICKAKKAFYTTGCRELIITVFKGTAEMVLGVTIPLIIVEVLIAIFGCLLCQKKKRRCGLDEEAK